MSVAQNTAFSIIRVCFVYQKSHNIMQRCNNFKSFLESERSEKITNVRKRRKRTVQVKNESVESEVKQIIENPDLTDKQRLFCVYYSRCFNATKAYQKAYGCSYETAMVEGSSHLRNPKIKSEIFHLKQENARLFIGF